MTSLEWHSPLSLPGTKAGGIFCWPRDERNEYQGVSVERAVQVLEALSIDLEIQATLQQPAGATGAELLGESQQTSWVDGWVERHDQNAASPLA